MILKSIELANLPTKIHKLERLSGKVGKNIYIKRDDETGTEIMGNKVRKLEFSVQEALDQGADYLITCGGIQSNHARATAAVAAKMGLGSYLLLRGREDNQTEGNLLLDKVLGARISYISGEDYANHRQELMEDIKGQLAQEGHKAYIIPEGASNGIGSFGYYKAMEEILKQEEEMGIKFDALVVAIGSGGSYAGLYYGNHINNNPAKIMGINICDSSHFFKERVAGLIDEMSHYTGKTISFDKEEFDIIDGYVGLGYARSQEEEISFIREFAQLEGIILDPVYTGKAMYGLVKEIEKGSFAGYENILFIHTGGIFGWASGQIELLDSI